MAPQRVLPYNPAMPDAVIDPVFRSGPVLVLGARGMLGRSWARLLESQGIKARLLDLPEFDITKPEHLAAAVTDEFPLVVNCAAWTDVDGAEAHEAAAAEVNAGAVGSLARRCRETGALLVHYSTDFVFDGKARAPYRPEDRPTRSTPTAGPSSPGRRP